MSVNSVTIGRHYFTDEGELCQVQGSVRPYRSLENLVIIDRIIPTVYKMDDPRPVAVPQDVFWATFDEVQGDTKRCTVFDGSEGQLLELIRRLPVRSNPEQNELVAILSHPDNTACDAGQHVTAANSNDIEREARRRGYLLMLVTGAALSTNTTEEALRSTVLQLSTANYGPRAYAHIFIEKQKYD